LGGLVLGRDADSGNFVEAVRRTGEGDLPTGLMQRYFRASKEKRKRGKITGLGKGKKERLVKRALLA